jgi:hypothetical protein
MSNKRHYFWIDLSAWALPLSIWGSSVGDFGIAILCFHYHFDPQGDV